MTLSAPIGVDDDRGTTNRILAIGAHDRAWPTVSGWPAEG
jgi:hypothetical protein